MYLPCVKSRLDAAKNQFLYLCAKNGMRKKMDFKVSSNFWITHSNDEFILNLSINTTS